MFHPSQDDIYLLIVYIFEPTGKKCLTCHIARVISKKKFLLCLIINYQNLKSRLCFDKFCTTTSINNSLLTLETLRTRETDGISFYLYTHINFFLSERCYSNKRLSSIQIYEVKSCHGSGININSRENINNVKFKGEITHLYLNG